MPPNAQGSPLQQSPTAPDVTRAEAEGPHPGLSCAHGPVLQEAVGLQGKGLHSQVGSGNTADPRLHRDVSPLRPMVGSTVNISLVQAPWTQPLPCSSHTQKGRARPVGRLRGCKTVGVWTPVLLRGPRGPGSHRPRHLTSSQDQPPLSLLPPVCQAPEPPPGALPTPKKSPRDVSRKNRGPPSLSPRGPPMSMLTFLGEAQPPPGK